MPAERFLFLPLSRQGMGSGHLRRCFDTASQLEGQSAILIDDTHPQSILPEDWTKVIPGFPGKIPVLLTSEAHRSDTHSDTLAIFDRRSSDKEDLLLWADKAAPVLLDDDGPARKLAPFILDTIPGPRDSRANEASPSWMNLPPHRRSPDPGGSILLSFGGEDPSGLTIPLTELLLSQFDINPSRIHVTLPPGIPSSYLPRGVGVVDSPGDLKTYLAEYGLVICSYGLTAWEAIAAGSAVITADPTDYHARLSREAGFPGLGRVDSESRRSIKRIRKKLQILLDSPETLSSKAEKLRTDLGSHKNSLASLLLSLEAPRPRCLGCGEVLPPVIARFPRRSYYRCPVCRITGLYRFNIPAVEYTPSYFLEEYRKQYGRSYLEDCSAIKAMAAPRLSQISRKAKKGGSLLDIGCAFGPFLDASRDAGFSPYGCDISEEAAAYVRESLGIPAVSASFPSDNPLEVLKLEKPDVVTLWYVIEHFSNLDEVLKALNVLLSDNGVLAFSTPNGTGISARRSLRQFLEKSPADHYSIWTPGVARRLLARYGFRVYKIRVTGHHPERFGPLPAAGSLLKRPLGVISRLFGLGDTFEVYAVKEHSLG